MYPAADTRNQLLHALDRAKRSGVRLKLLKLSTREAFHVRKNLWAREDGVKTFAGVPIKVVNEDRWI